jgi:hypothetical protein
MRAARATEERGSVAVWSASTSSVEFDTWLLLQDLVHPGLLRHLPNPLEGSLDQIPSPPQPPRHGRFAARFADLCFVDTEVTRSSCEQRCTGSGQVPGGQQPARTMTTRPPRQALLISHVARLCVTGPFGRGRTSTASATGCTTGEKAGPVRDPPQDGGAYAPSGGSRTRPSSSGARTAGPPPDSPVLNREKDLRAWQRGQYSRADLERSVGDSCPALRES